MQSLSLSLRARALALSDKDGEIDVEEFKQRAATLGQGDDSKMEALFHFFDNRGAQHRKHRNDGKLSQDEW